MSPSRIFAVFLARNREFYRDRATLLWNVILPIAVVFGFAFAFSGSAPERYVIGVMGVEQEQFDEHASPALQMKHVEYTAIDSLDMGRTKLRRQQIDLLIDPEQKRYWISDASPGSYVTEQMLRGVMAGEGEYARETVSGRTIRYVDWLIPGLLSANLMVMALFGVGFVIVRYRRNGVLKRLKATPLTAAEFLVAQLTSRLVIIAIITTAIFVGSYFTLGFPVYGSWFNLLLIMLLGGFCMISLGLVIAARLVSEELASGLLDVISLPMMFLCGVWFSTEALHPWLQVVTAVLPLTHIIEAARGVMIEGQGLAGIAPHLLILAAMSVAFVAVGAALFRWE